MRKVKEYLAWGGCDLAALKSRGMEKKAAFAQRWPVEPELNESSRLKKASSSSDCAAAAVEVEPKETRESRARWLVD